jgi:predicted nucleic acid-binding protein
VTYLLDTCLVSEVWKPRPNRGVLAWLDTSLEDELHLSVLSLGEIRKGIEQLPAGKKRDGLVRDHAALRSRFSTRILPVTDVIAERWGELSAAAGAGRAVHVIDGLVAATALVHGLTVVTRNVVAFAATPVPLENPWT